MGNLTKEQSDELSDLTGQAAQRVSSQWPGAVEKEDLQQDITVRLLESPGALEKFFEEPEKQVRQSFLIKLGHQIASEIQQDYERFSGNYLYDVGQVRGLLDQQAWLIEGKVSIEKLDLEEGLAILAAKNSVYYAEIVNRFVHDIVPDRTDSGAFKRIERAIGSLTEIMNRLGSERKKNYTEGPGSRRALTNARAGVVLKNQFEEAR